MLLGKRHKKIVASTVAEIRGSLPLVREGLLEEVRKHHISIDSNFIPLTGQSIPGIDVSRLFMACQSIGPL